MSNSPLRGLYEPVKPLCKFNELAALKKLTQAEKLISTNERVIRERLLTKVMKHRKRSCSLAQKRALTTLVNDLKTVEGAKLDILKELSNYIGKFLPKILEKVFNENEEIFSSFFGNYLSEFCSNYEPNIKLVITVNTRNYKYLNNRFSTYDNIAIASNDGLDLFTAAISSDLGQVVISKREECLFFFSELERSFSLNSTTS
jgi:hypothetical protein